MIFAKGEIITSLIPDIVNILLIATIIEMTRMVGNSSVIAKIKLLKRLLTESLTDNVDTAASEKMPTIHTMVVSRRKSIKPMIATMNAK